SEQLSILDLNDYCLGQIIRYLRVEDHVQFAQTCTHFRAVLRDWSHVLYPEFEITRLNDADAGSGVEWQLQLLGIVRDVVRRLNLDIRQVDGEQALQEHDFVENLCSQIREMESLEYIAVNEGSLLGRLVNTSSPLRYQCMEKVLSALEQLPKVHSVSLSCRTNNLIRMRGLERVSIDTTIASEDLVEICQSNANLRVLWIREVVGELTDIVPHCPNLEEIAFPMFASHKSYAALAELPKIRKLVIKGTNLTSPCAKLMELFDAFVEQERSQLESVILYTYLNYRETIKLIELRGLKELRCCFDDARCIDLLTDLTELEGLYIMLGRSGAGASECINILKSCRKLQRLHINSNLNIDFVDKALAVLR
ncbi:hypothetical protein KR222_003917, partial [Zaprionus bogoriensis]